MAIIKHNPKNHARVGAQSWRNFLRHLKERGLSGVRLFISDKSLGLLEALGEFYPEAGRSAGAGGTEAAHAAANWAGV